MELDNFAEALEALVASGAANYGDGASIEELHRLHSRFESFVTEATAAFEAGRSGRPTGPRRPRRGSPRVVGSRVAAAKRRVRLGRALRHLPECAEAWREGAIGVDQAQAIASARRHRTESSMARDEAMLVAQASRDGLRGLLPGLAYWKQLADPDGADAAEEERKASRNVFLESSFTGMWLGQMTLDPVSGSIVSGELNRLEHDLFEADCAEAKERLGRPARIDELARTSAQRRADALVEMATRSRTAPADGIRPAPLFTRLRRLRDAPRAHLRARERHGPPAHGPHALDGLGLLRAGHLLAWATGSTSACGPASSPVGHGGPSSCATASAPIPHCYEPAENCQVDHIETYAAGGLTTQENGRLLCGFHNRLRNQRERSPRLGAAAQQRPPTPDAA